MSRIISFCGLIGLVWLSFSCAKSTVGELVTPLQKVERRKTSELVQAIDSISKKLPNTFYTKIATRYKDTNQQLSFKTSIRLVKDSALTALVTYAGIPLFQSLLTKDSLQYTNKRNKCFSKSTLTQLKDHFGVDFDFANVQQILLGLPLGYQSTTKYFQIHNPYTYIVSNYRKREIKKLERKNLDDFILKYYLDSTISRLQKIEIENPKDSTYITVNYINYDMEEGFSVPSELSIRIISKKNSIFVDMEYDKIEVNQPQEIIFTIPESYEICN